MKNYFIVFYILNIGYKIDLEGQLPSLQNQRRLIESDISQNQTLLYLFINNLYHKYPTLQDVKPEEITYYFSKELPDIVYYINIDKNI